MGNKRAELRVLSAIEQKEKSNQTESDSEVSKYIKTFKNKVEEELQTLCMDVINLLTQKLLPNSLEIDNKIFYLKMKADYYRYLAEFILDDNL